MPPRVYREDDACMVKGALDDYRIQPRAAARFLVDDEPADRKWMQLPMFLPVVHVFIRSQDRLGL